MVQEEAFYDSDIEAVNAAIVKSGRKAKEVAHGLWPHLKMDTAYARLKNALNADKAEKLTLDEIILICRLTHRFDPLFYMADELSHARPVFKEPKDQEADLAHETQRLADQVSRLMQRFDRLSERRMTVRGV